MSDDQYFIKMSEIIMRHLQQRYPNSFEQVGLTQDNIISILEKKRDLLSDKQGLTHIINIIDNVIKTRINGPNTILHDIDTTKFSMDTSSTIPYDKYVNNNLNTSTNASFKLDPANTSNTKLTTDNIAQFKDGGILQTYQEENILNDRMNTKYFSDDLRKKEIYLYIDSKDRDFDTYPDANGYELDLSEHALSRVKAVTLTDIVLIDSSNTDMSSDNLSIPPYITLEIIGLPERQNYNSAGSNDKLTDCFTILKKYELQNNYKYYDLNITRKYENTIAIDKIKINFRLPDGSLFNFGNANNELRRTVSLLTFKLLLD